jgi:hypothetical protein
MRYTEHDINPQECRRDGIRSVLFPFRKKSRKRSRMIASGQLISSFVSFHVVHCMKFNTFWIEFRQCFGEFEVSIE